MTTVAVREPEQGSLWAEEDTPGPRRPKTDNIRAEVPWEWVPVELILTLESVDFGGLDDESEFTNGAYGWGGLTEANLDKKRSDDGYEEMLNSVAVEGFYDPIMIHKPVAGDNSYTDSWTMGNGHHRLAIAIDLGFTHVPVTFDAYFEWDSTGPCTTDYDLSE